MTLRHYLIIMILSTLLCAVALGVVVINVNPAETSRFGLSFFFVSFFLAILGFLSIAFFGILRFFGREKLPMFRYVERSFRDAFLLAIFVTAFLALQGARIIFWPPRTHLAIVSGAVGAVAFAVWRESRDGAIAPS